MKALFLFLSMFTFTMGMAQIDKDRLALDINKAEEANTQKLKEYIWNRKSEVLIEGQLKLTTITQFSFDSTGKVQAKIIDSESTVKEKGGIRGKMQENAAQEKLDYVQKALELSLSYTYMSKGQLIDFLSKANVKQEGDVIEATAENVYVKGDKLMVKIDAKTNLFLNKKFSSLLGTQPISGEINYEKFSSGVSHGSTTVLNMPSEKMVINAKNQDYSQRVR